MEALVFSAEQYIENFVNKYSELLKLDLDEELLEKSDKPTTALKDLVIRRNYKFHDKHHVELAVKSGEVIKEKFGKSPVTCYFSNALNGRFSLNALVHKWTEDSITLSFLSKDIKDLEIKAELSSYECEIKAKVNTTTYDRTIA